MAAADGFDAVVVGSGPNGLIGAVMLADAGLRVLLLEGAEEFGGGLRSAALTLDGFTHDVCSTVLPMARVSAAFRDLNLPVEWAYPQVQAAHPLDGQDAVLVHRDVGQTADGLGSARDAAAWRQSVGATARGGFGLLDSLLAPLSVPRAPLRLARYGALGVLPATVLGRLLFGGERGRAVLAGMAAHSMVDLHDPITGGYGLLLAALAHRFGWPLVRGGSAQLAAALIDRLTSRGGVAETGQVVRDLSDVPRARVILLDITPAQLLAVCGDRLPAEYAHRLRRFRYGPGVFKLDWALSGPVPWKDPAVSRAATVHLGGTLAEIAAGEAEVAVGRHPDRPFVLAVQPCVADPTRAPAGRHVLWAYCHVPNGSTVDMTTAIEDQIERFAPGFRDLILARVAHDTAAMERHNPNLVGGDISGGDSGLVQFVRRPIVSPHPWATPLPGVYLCSASTPPGAAVHGMGGYHAARLALARLLSPGASPWVNSLAIPVQPAYVRGMAEDLPGLPAAAAERWLSEALPSLLRDGPWRAEVISGGLSNITYRLWLPGGTVILRRPPRGHVLPRAHDMAREYRVLRALHGTPVPVPEPLALCSDPGVLGVTFYAMRDVPGSVLRKPEDTGALSPAARGELASSLIGVLADLHDVSPDAVGLGDYGRRSGYCVRQIRTWGAQWERSRTRDLPDMERLLARLAELAPEDSACTIVHGDFRLDNTVVSLAASTGPPRVAAVLDWELSTLGDPLADLATTMSYWHDPGDVERGEIPVSAGLTDKPGFPAARALAAQYAERTGRSLDNLPFYLGLAWMKLGVICEGVHARYLGGQTVGEGYEKVGPAVPLLAERGLHELGAV